MGFAATGGLGLSLLAGHLVDPRPCGKAIVEGGGQGRRRKDNGWVRLAKDGCRPWRARASTATRSCGANGTATGLRSWPDSSGPGRSFLVSWGLAGVGGRTRSSTEGADQSSELAAHYGPDAVQVTFGLLMLSGHSADGSGSEERMRGSLDILLSDARCRPDRSSGPSGGGRTARSLVLLPLPLLASILVAGSMLRDRRGPDDGDDRLGRAPGRDGPLPDAAGGDVRPGREGCDRRLCQHRDQSSA